MRKIIVLVTVLMTLTLLGWAMRKQLFRQKVKRDSQAVARHRKDSIFKKIVYDTVLLRKFGSACLVFNDQTRPLTYSGLMNVTNGADSTGNVKNLDFVYCRNGNDCYYKTGRTETLNAAGVYLYIENDHKRVVVAPQKAVTPAPLAGMNRLTANLQSEHYDMLNKTSGKYETISLVNEHHITCKEYAITFDTTSYKISRIYIRLTCLADPLNKKKDKVVDVHLNTFVTAADPGQYLNKDNVITRVGDKWKLKPAYTGFILIHVPQ